MANIQAKPVLRPVAAALGTLLAICGSSAAAQTPAARNAHNQPPTVKDVALTPLSDLNITKDPIPDILKKARSDPYADKGLDSCAAIHRAVGNLTAVLGQDFDTAPANKYKTGPTDVAQTVVGYFIPFGGLIRKISGADAHAFKFREAITAGLMRRAYLKGMGQKMGCKYPARPAPPALVAKLRAERVAAKHSGKQNQKNQQPEPTPAQEPTPKAEAKDQQQPSGQAAAPGQSTGKSDEGKTRYVSHPVVQKLK